MNIKKAQNKEAFGLLKFHWQEAGQEKYSAANKCYIS